MIPATVEREKALIESLRKGKNSAKRSLYEHFHNYLAAVCARYVGNDEDVKDLLQEVFIKIYSRFDTFEYRGGGSLQAWCRRIAVNESLQEFGELPEPDDTPDVETIPQRDLLSLIQRLPERYRTVFNLYIFEEMSHAEIAAMLQIGESTSASNLHRAKALLTKWIKEYRRNEG